MAQVRLAFYKPFFFGIFLIAILAANYSSRSQIITTVAGNGLPVFSGDGGPATAAGMHFPYGLEVDSIGNVYIASGDNRIRKIDTAGIITTVAGAAGSGFSGDGGPATAATFDATYDVALDGMGNIYICDGLGHNRIRKVNSVGIINTIAGNGIFGYTGDGGPATNASIEAGSVAVDLAGNVYLPATGAIRKVNAAGIITTIAGTGVVGFSGDGGPAATAQLTVTDIDVDRYGNIFFADKANNRVRKIDTAGIITTIAGNGTAGYSGDGGPATAAQFSIYTEGVTVDDAGNVLITDRYNNRVRKVNSLGIVTTLAGDGTLGFGGDGGPATAAQLQYIRHVAKYGSGNIYIADRNNDRVRMVTDINHPVYFTGGHSLLFNVCAPSVSIDTLLAAADSNTGQVSRWRLIYGPFHGTVAASYVTYTTGGTMLPSGLTYAPYAGYTGFDTFKVCASDGYSSDTTTVYVRIDTTLPYADTVNGPDTVCIGKSITLTDSVAGGIFSSLHGNASVAGSIVTGLTTGIDTILYVVTNACGKDTAMHIVQVKACPDAVTDVRNERPLQMWPNPVGTELTIIADDTYTSCNITNVIGQSLVQLSLNCSKTKLNVSMLSPGLYYITLTGDKGNVVRKFIRQ